jgi:hypothetical protein
MKGEYYSDSCNPKITINEQSSHMPNLISVFFPVSSDLVLIVQPFFGTSFPHFGHLVTSSHPFFRKYLILNNISFMKVKFILKKIKLWIVWIT